MLRPLHGISTTVEQRNNDKRQSCDLSFPYRKQKTDGLSMTQIAAGLQTGILAHSRITTHSNMIRNFFPDVFGYERKHQHVPQTDRVRSVFGIVILDVDRLCDGRRRTVLR